MNTIKETNNQTTVNSSNNTTRSIFCSMPIEIIDHLCKYLDLKSILNTSETCKTLNFYIFSNIPLNKIKQIYVCKAYFFINKNIDFINNSNDVLVKHLDYLTEKPVTKKNAITWINASKLKNASKDYGSSFVLAYIMSEGFYKFNQVNELNIKYFPPVNKINDSSFFREKNSFTEFHFTNYYNEYLVFTNNEIYLINLDANKTKTKEIKYIGSINDFLKHKFIDIQKIIFFQYEFIIISLFNGNSIILKKDQDAYSGITPKAIRAIYNKTFLILKDSSNQPYFLICLNNKVYQHNEQQLLEISTNPKNIDCNLRDITPAGLIVYRISSSENGKLILFYGKNSSNQEQIELHVQFNGEIIDKISLAVYSNYFDKNRTHQFICSPKGTSFTLKNIITDKSKQVGKHDIAIVLYKISANKLNKMKIAQYSYNFNDQYKVSYETDNILNITMKIVDRLNKDYTLVFVTSAYAKDNNDINTQCKHENKALLMIFNQTKNMYALYNEKQINPQHINKKFRYCLYQIKICTIKNENISDSSTINCIQAVREIVFSPNSQLVVTQEIYFKNNTVFNTLRAYRIIKKNNEGDLIFLKNAELIAEFVINEYINNFYFHISGFKIILHTAKSIKILDLEKDLS